VAVGAAVGVEQAQGVVGVREGKRAEEDGVDQAEDGGVAADAYGESKQDYSGEAWGFAEEAEGVAEVLVEEVDQGSPGLVELLRWGFDG
jgi:hypothetical protein